MANTTNFGWETPDDTDLVKDGAAAMRTLGNSIDASFVDLKGGTTGQVLAKASNTDLDFVWSADAAGIPPTIFDAKGDLIAASAADTAARLAVGTNGTVLTADSTTATGLRWATPAGGGLNWTLLNAGGTALSGTNQTTISGISNRTDLLIVWENASVTGTLDEIIIRINNDTGGNYGNFMQTINAQATISAPSFSATGGFGSDGFYVNRTSTNAGSESFGYVRLEGCTSGDLVSAIFSAGATTNTGNSQTQRTGAGIYDGTAAVSSVTIRAVNSTFDAGRVYVYGA